MPLHLTTAMDVNGNKILKVLALHRGEIRGKFSVQTNGNLPTTHRYGVVAETTMRELQEYVTEFGTERQKLLIRFANHP